MTRSGIEPATALTRDVRSTITPQRRFMATFQQHGLIERQLTYRAFVCCKVLFFSKHQHKPYLCGISGKIEGEIKSYDSGEITPE